MSTSNPAYAVLFGILLATAIAVTRARGLYAAAMLMGLFSLVSASLFVLLDAVDVALTEAAVGAGITTVLFVTALALTQSSEATTPRRRVWPAGLVALLTGAGLLYASQDLPPVGAADTPAQQNRITTSYLEDSYDETGIPNTVTSILASYRGYDTLGEVVVIFTAGAGVLLLITRPRRPDDPVPADRGIGGPAPDPPEREPAPSTADRAPVPGSAVRRERRTQMHVEYRVLRVVTKTLMPFILLFALYVLLHGDYGPGGGFQAGVIFAAGFVLYSLVFGRVSAQRVLPMGILLRLIPAGVLMFAGVGIADTLLGGAFLDYDAFDPSSPQGAQQAGVLLVEIAVGITVAAVLTAMFYAFVGRGESR